MGKVPVYLTIAQDIISMIQNETLKSGDQLMTEAQICEKYNVSRMTANKAFSTLAAQGYINRTAGKGSFVAEPKFEKDIVKASSFSADMASINKKPGAILVEYKVMRAEEIPSVRKHLKLSPDELVHYIHRIRTSDDVRIALSYTYIPCKYLPALDVTILEDSLYAYLEREYHIIPRVTDHYFSAVLPTQKQLELLQVDSCALLNSSHISVSAPNQLFEYTETYYIGSKYTYHLSTM